MVLLSTGVTVCGSIIYWSNCSLDLLFTGVTASWFFYSTGVIVCGSINFWRICSVVLLSPGVTAPWFYYLLE